MSHQTAVSVIIPSYNGQKLLAENLLKVIEQLEEDDELVIVDDASSDDSVLYLIKKFGLEKIAESGDEYGEFELFAGSTANGASIKLIVNQQNLRYAASCNRGVLQSSNPLLFLLNNDVVICKNTIKSLVNQFKNDESNRLFAVGSMETEPNEGGIKGGKNKLWFEKGLFHHSRADDFESGSTAWASGGSAMFSRDKWMELGGFDVAYYPAYWEDIDLSQRAREKGWEVRFCSKAKVIHDHQTTNKEVFADNQLKQISWKHADRFTWKHSNLLQKMQYLLFRPYWSWQRWKISSSSFYRLGFLIILLITALLRFYKLGQVPAGMTWDEAAIGYNGYAVVQTRRDEWLEFLPISFRSFGDYKAPLAIYLVGIFTTVLNLNLLTVRLPFAISGVFGVWGMILLTKELLPIHLADLKTRDTFWLEALSLAAGLMLAITPWHIHFTRTGFESGLALTFIVWGAYFVARYLQQQSQKFWQRVKSILMAVSLLAASMYTYHSPKLFVPLIVLTLGIIHWKFLKRRLVDVFTSGGLFLLLLSPMIYDSFWGEGLTRAGSLEALESGSVLKAAEHILIRYVAHLSPAFLIGGWTDTLRHGATAHSVFLEIVFGLILVGVATLIINFVKTKKISVWFKLSLTWIILGLLPAAMGDLYPQANRALLALPGFIWLALVGVKVTADLLTSVFTSEKIKPKHSLFIIALLLVGNLSLYLNHYYTEFAANSADAFSEGYIEAMELAYQYERGTDGKPEVSEIIISARYGQPYIYTLFVRKTNPIWYQGGSLWKYKFVGDVNAGDLEQDNALVIATKSSQMSDREPDHVIFDSNQEVRFKLYYTGKVEN